MNSDKTEPDTKETARELGHLWVIAFISRLGSVLGGFLAAVIATIMASISAMLSLREAVVMVDISKQLLTIAAGVGIVTAVLGIFTLILARIREGSAKEKALKSALITAFFQALDKSGLNPAQESGTAPKR